MQPPLPPFGPKPTPVAHPIMPPPPKSKSGQKYEKSMEFTKSAFKVAKFPFFWRGIQCWKNSMHPGSGYPQDYLLGKVMGTGLILFSPIGIGVNAGAALVTAGGAAYAVAAKTINTIEQKLEEDQYRRYITGQFVDSLYERLAEMTEEQKNFHKENPEILAGSEAIDIAFLNRHVYGNRLNISENKVIEENQIESSLTKEYFLDVCAIKLAINALNYSLLDDAHAWNDFQVEADLMNAGDPEALSDAHRLEQFEKISSAASKFASKIKKDEVFMSAWQAKFAVAAP